MCSFWIVSKLNGISSWSFSVCEVDFPYNAWVSNKMEIKINFAIDKPQSLKWITSEQLPIPLYTLVSGKTRGLYVSSTWADLYMQKMQFTCHSISNKRMGEKALLHTPMQTYVYVRMLKTKTQNQAREKKMPLQAPQPKISQKYQKKKLEIYCSMQIFI